MSVPTAAVCTVAKILSLKYIPRRELALNINGHMATQFVQFPRGASLGVSE